MGDRTAGRQQKSSVPNPVRLAVLWIGLALSRVGLIDRERAIKATNLAWPRMVTGLARMSKDAVDIAMVGVAVGTSAVAGVGLAGPFWGVIFAVGTGVAGGTIALVSQRFGADAYDELGTAVRSSAILVLAVSLPFVWFFWSYPHLLISLLTSNERVISHGAEYLRIVAFGTPFLALNLVGSRVLMGCDDSYTAMQIRVTGAMVNIVLNTIFIFGIGLGVTGAALGTTVSNVAVAAAFAIGLVRGSLPWIGAFPVTIDPTGRYLDPDVLADLVTIGTPIGLRSLVWAAFEFPMLGILDMYGENTVAAYVIARRIWGLMNAPGWGFGLAASSLVGQALGRNDETVAEDYGRDIVLFSTVTYAVFAVVVAIFVHDIVTLFSDDPASGEIPIAVNLVYAACVAMLFQSVASATAGPLEASGDTTIPFVSQFTGMFCVAVPVAYLGAVSELGYWGLYLAFLGEAAIPAVLNYWRFRSGVWKSISEAYRPDAGPADD
ncbi:MATE family efflux transporter [Natrarchaeobius sp. A-rgal3]|uniref:MATE family efflux transporter n=1 Tax=Natrarchaeobius versutus TaxID=1679078 RepID=UPI0035105CF8